MKHSLFNQGGACASVFALLTALSLGASACSDSAGDCRETRSCPVNAAGAGGSGVSGTGAKAGASPGGKGGKGSGGSSDTGGDAVVGGTSGVSGSGMSGAGGDAGSGGTSCDTTKSPGDEACLVSDEFAVFVSPNGDDKKDGTKASPFATLTKAAEAAGEKAVLVCDATYNEHVSITVGARVYGGFKCTDWGVEVGKPLFKPATAGTALKIDGVAADDVLIDSVNFEVGDATAAGETALAAIVNASPKVTLRAVHVKAGKGKAGANGSLTNFVPADKATLKGNPENPLIPGTGGDAKACACQAALQSVGGIGGAAVLGGQAGSKGLPDRGAGQPGTPGSCVPNGGGGDGGNAPAADPANGASTLGVATASGWQPAAGTDGATGSPGQGGGGGASRNSLGHGGGGGCGGCGGNGGTGGKGGGSSIALLALNSPVILEASTLTTTDAGNGGTGATGQAGQKEAGGGGNTIDNQNSCGGGAGGFGGDGGAGGGGAGGISVGIAWKGAMQPTVSVDTTTTNGKAGAKGVGGAGTNDGIAGVSQKILSLN